MEQKNLVPKRRFKEFQNTSAWEQRKLGEMGDTFTGLSGKTKEDFGHGDAKFVTYINVFSNPISDPYGTESVEIDSKQKEVKYGDVFFTTSSETPEEVGMSSVWLENTENVYLNSFCFGYRPTVEFDPYYLAFMLRSPVVRKKFMFLAQGISRYNISKNKVMDMLVSVPTLEEQKKVGAFYKELENLITLHQRKLEKMKALKSAYLSEMFPAEGERVPKRRFAGFTQAWEHRRLGDHAEILTGGTPNTSILEYWEPKEIPWMSSGEVNKRRIDETDNMISEEGLNNSSTRWVKEHSVLIALAGQGKTRGTVAINNIPLTTNQSIAAIVPDKTLHYEFIFQNLIKRYDELRVISSGDGTRGGLNKQIVSDVVIPYTSIEEQEKIGTFFLKLDNLITLHQRKLEKLQYIKKAYLNEMFV